MSQLGQQNNMKYPQRMTVAVMPVPHCLEVNKSEEDGSLTLDGFEGKYLQIVLKELGFQYDITIPNDRMWGYLQPNGTWTGMIGMIYRGEADLAFSGIGVNEDRYKAINFSRSYTYEGGTFVTYMPGNMKSTFSFLYPFLVCFANRSDSFVHHVHEMSQGKVYYR
ncbi:uncharacterized protein NPIL_499151 [Nephila pilipes]|uniref:Ionotropic glutamate receptor L-glutamate and glycine-binding domain-containing protein n=1 Tax=Nephila pilipes TaxID=299642 RepID=A0A8X6N394_NEPPI|nr:uncharacterized protein NPIL_499151 [Nephila pilipes]